MAFTTLQDLGIDSPYKKEKYDNYINNQWVKPVDGKYFENITPISGNPFCEVARSNEKDINLALDAGHAAKDAWGKTSATERANILLKIADRMEQNLETIIQFVRNFIHNTSQIRILNGFIINILCRTFC